MGGFTEPKKEKTLKAKVRHSSDPKTLLVYPQTYMNESGRSVQAVVHWYKLTDLSCLLLVYDEIALPLGQLRWAKSGGAGGHHGLESIQRELGARDIVRLRFGIGPDPGGARRADYVLSTFGVDERDLLESTLKRAVLSLREYLGGVDLSALMTKYNKAEL